MSLPADAYMTAHELMTQPLDLSDIELAAVRAGLVLDMNDFDCRR